MNLGAMLDLGVEVDRLRAELEKLNLDGWELRAEKDVRGGIAGMRCTVVLEEEKAHSHEADHNNHSHPHSHSHDHTHNHGHTHSHPHDHSHSHDHDHSHSHDHSHTHDHHHGRNYKEIRELIEASELANSVKKRAIAMFHVLAVAEAAVHGVDLDTVHFHEVGAVDSIVDIVGAAVCWDLLGVTEVRCDHLELGGGTVRCEHGVMPVPAPATAKILEGYPVRLRGTDKEATTPTGACILVGGGAAFEAQASGVVKKTGIGVGQRHDNNLANVCFVTLMQKEAAAASQKAVIELAVNLDDSSPEDLAHVANELLEKGALDVWQTAATFKKSRLGVVLHVLAKEENVGELESYLLQATTTLGVRRQWWERSVLDRKEILVETSLGPVRVKSPKDQKAGRGKPEFDDLAALAAEHGLSLAEVRAQVVAEIEKQNLGA